MTTTVFDTLIERRTSGCLKWNAYDEDVLPVWVADMDFHSPEPILKALHQRVDHGVFGYQFDDPPVRQVIAQRMNERYGWSVETRDIVFVPNLVSALNFVCTAYAEPGDEVLMSTPVYPPFIVAPGNSGRVATMVDMPIVRSGQQMRYEIDFDAFEAAITPRTKLFILCSPHNPVGRAWTRPELERLAEICLHHNLTIVSDEIHCDLLLDPLQHIPLASLSPEVAARTITLMSPSKTFNLPTLGFAFAIAQNETVRQQFEKATAWFLPHPGALGYTAALAAYRDCQPWLDELLVYLRGNRDFMADFLQSHLPQIPYTHPEATYLAWLDFRALNLPASPYQVMLEKARVAFNDGAAFGKAGEGFVRLNLGTSRERLREVLERVRAVVEDL